MTDCTVTKFIKTGSEHTFSEMCSLPIIKLFNFYFNQLVNNVTFLLSRAYSILMATGGYIRPHYALLKQSFAVKHYYDNDMDIKKQIGHEYIISHNLKILRSI